MPLPLIPSMYSGLPRNTVPHIGPNNAPNWGPARPMVMVSDPNKLSYFARANAIRAGVRGTYGTLGDAFPQRIVPDGVDAYTVPGNSTITDVTGAGYGFSTQALYNNGAPMAVQNAADTGIGGGTATVDAWVRRLNSLLSPTQQPATEDAAASPVSAALPRSPLALILGGAVLGYIGLKLMRKA